MIVPMAYAIPQNGDWSTRRGFGDLLEIGLFNWYLDSYNEEILNLDRESQNPGWSIGGGQIDLE